MDRQTLDYEFFIIKTSTKNKCISDFIIISINSFRQSFHELSSNTLMHLALRRININKIIH